MAACNGWPLIGRLTSPSFLAEPFIASQPDSEQEQTGVERESTRGHQPIEFPEGLVIANQNR